MLKFKNRKDIRGDNNVNLRGKGMRLFLLTERSSQVLNYSRRN